MGTKVWFVRHGEVASHHIGRFVGTTEAPLSSLGHHQADAIAAFLAEAEVDAILSSPRRRSRDTVEPLAKARGLPIETRPGLAEMDFGHWEDLTWLEIEAAHGDLARSWRENPGPTQCPGGQSPDDFAACVSEEMDRILDEFKDRSVVIGAHAGVNRAILSHIMERPYIEMFRFSQEYGCVNAAAWGVQDWTQIALLNLVPGPRSEHPSW